MNENNFEFNKKNSDKILYAADKKAKELSQKKPEQSTENIDALGERPFSGHPIPKRDNGEEENPRDNLEGK